jgi:hypothetical protein
LKYRQLGASALQVPVISLGSWLTYSGGIEKRQATACIHKAVDLGINRIRFGLPAFGARICYTAASSQWAASISTSLNFDFTSENFATVAAWAPECERRAMTIDGKD